MCPTAKVAMDTVRNKLHGRLISKFGYTEWPPMSPDLTATVFFCGCLKSKVDKNNPTTIENFKAIIRAERNINDPSMLQRIRVMSSMHGCLAGGGDPAKSIKKSTVS